jgi:hypothetical protein
VEFAYRTIVQACTVNLSSESLLMRSLAQYLSTVLSTRTRPSTSSNVVPVVLYCHCKTFMSSFQTLQYLVPLKYYSCVLSLIIDECTVPNFHTICDQLGAVDRARIPATGMGNPSSNPSNPPAGGRRARASRIRIDPPAPPLLRAGQQLADEALR